MAEALVKCRCGNDMSVSEKMRYAYCTHCDDTVCPNGLKLTLTADGCSLCAALIES